MQKPAVFGGHCRKKKVGGATRRGIVIGAIENLRRLRKRGDHQSIPVGQNLVVFWRMDTVIWGGKELLPAGFEPPPRIGGRWWNGEMKNVRMDIAFDGSEIPTFLDPVRFDHQVGIVAGDSTNLCFGPEIELPFLPLAVGIFG